MHRVNVCVIACITMSMSMSNAFELLSYEVGRVFSRAQEEC